MALLDSVKKKSTQTNLIKFNHDKTVSIKKAEVTRSIIVDDKEGFLARNSAFTEFSEDKLFGFITPLLFKSVTRLLNSVNDKCK